MSEKYLVVNNLSGHEFDIGIVVWIDLEHGDGAYTDGNDYWYMGEEDISLIKAPDPGWADIGSAPKDGTEIIVSGPTGGIKGNSRMWVTMAYWSEGEWFQSSDVELHEPTHWMHFPSPPVA